MARRRPRHQATLWDEPEPDVQDVGPRVTPTALDLAQRVESETWAARVAHFERFGIKPPPLCPKHGQHPTGVVPYRRVRVRHVLDVVWMLRAGRDVDRFDRVVVTRPVVLPPCRPCQMKRGADAAVAAVFRERGPMVEAGFTWILGRMERWADIEEEVRKKRTKEQA